MVWYKTWRVLAADDSTTIPPFLHRLGEYLSTKTGGVQAKDLEKK